MTDTNKKQNCIYDKYKKVKGIELTDTNKKQNILIFMCFLVYVASYLSRYSYNANIVAIIDYYGVTKADTGLVATMYFFAYGVGQVVNGLLCKRYNKRVVISSVLIISAVINFILFFKPDFAMYKYMWLVNGMVLSVLWSTLIYIICDNLEERKMNTAILVMSFPVSVGTCLSYGTSALLNISGAFNYSFLFGGMVALVVGVVWFMLYNHIKSDNSLYSQNRPKDETITTQSKSTKDVFFIVFMVVLGFFSVADNFIKDGLNTWVPQILKDSYGLSDSLSIVLTLVLPLLGMLSAFITIKLNEWISNNIKLTGLLYLLVAVLVGVVMYTICECSWIIIILLFGIVALLVHIINCLLTNIVPMRLRKQYNAGAITGILNGCCYLGSTISSYGLGALADNFGWNAIFELLVVTAVVCVVLSVVFYLISKIKKIEI